MANPFGRGCPGPGGSKPPPGAAVGSLKSDKRDKTNKLSGTSDRQLTAEKCPFKVNIPSNEQVRIRRTEFPKSQCSQSGKTFVQVTEEEKKKKMVMPSTSVAAPPIVSPDKGSKVSPMTTLTSVLPKSSFFSTKRKKTDGDDKLSRERIIQELHSLLSDNEFKEANVTNQSDYALRKHLFKAMSKTKKLKSNETETMDIGTLLLDSTMSYVPTLTEKSTDEDIARLEKHDAILELADFIRQCGKRVNFYELNLSSLEDLHNNIKLARDDHKRVKNVFPELCGVDSRWFGPRSERLDQDYENSDAGDVDLDDAWADLSDNEVDDLKNDINTIDSETPQKQGSENQKKSKVDLEEEHQKLLQELYTQVENKQGSTFDTPDDTSNWSKEKLSEEILKVGTTLGQTHYHSELMNSSRDYLRKQLHSLLMTIKDETKKIITSKGKGKENKIVNKKESDKANKKEKNKKENKKESVCVEKNENKKANKKETKKENKNVCEQKEREVGSDGEFEWEDDSGNNTSKSDNQSLSTQIGTGGSNDDVKNVEKRVANDGQQNEASALSTGNAQNTQKKQQNPIVVFNSDITDHKLQDLTRFDLITILAMHAAQNGKITDDYLVDTSQEELLELCEDLRSQIGLVDIVIQQEDVKDTRLRVIRWKKRSFEQKKAMNQNDIPGSFDPSFTLPSPSHETSKAHDNFSAASKTDDKDEDQGFKQHKTYASVDREEKLNESSQLDQPTGDMEGIDISMFTPKVKSNLNEPPPETQESASKVVVVTQKVFNIRVAYGLKQRGQHTPTDIKFFVRILRQIDPQLKLMPFSEDKNANVADTDVITDESHLPDQQEALSKWAASIEISYNNKLHFGIRVSSIMTFSALRRQLYDWCSKTKSFVKFDNILSRKIFGAGWLLGIHPMYHNRNTLKAVLCRDNPQLLEKISIYPRKVWLDSSAHNQKTKTNGIVIDGCFSQKDAIISHLCSYKWTGQYEGVTFIPFKVNEALTEKHQQTAMQEQNLYLRDTWSKVLPVKESIKPIKCVKTKRVYTFIQWLKLCEVHGKKLLKGVEYISNEKIRILYHRKSEHDVCQMLTYLFPAIEDQFGKQIAEELLGDKEKQMQHIKSKNIEHTYSTTCASKIMQRSNPQEDMVNQPPKVKFHSTFGSAPRIVTPSAGKGKKKSYSEASREKQIVLDPEMQAAIKELQDKQMEQSKTIVKLNEQLRIANESKQSNENENINDNRETNEDDNDVTNEMREEIKALWNSQEEMKKEINESMDEKLRTSKEQILAVVEENKTSISREIENLRTHQDTATKKIQEQQSVNTFNVLTAIEKLTNRLDSVSNQNLSYTGITKPSYKPG